MKTSAKGAEHWEAIHRSKPPSEVSWYQERPSRSLDYIRRVAADTSSRIIDVGGGASTLVDHLLADGYLNLTVLDISGSALELARRRLGPRAERVTWIEEEITQASLLPGVYDVWHDRAVFHFLTDPGDQRKYTEAVRRSLKPRGYAVVATFALDGPSRCSGLDVIRYSPESLLESFGDGFALLDTAQEVHHTPTGTEQRFVYCLLGKSG